MPINTCPTCGQRKIERQRSTLKLEVREQTYEITDLELDVCLNCGEQLFDLEASRRIEAVVYGQQPKHKSSGKTRKVQPSRNNTRTPLSTSPRRG